MFEKIRAIVCEQLGVEEEKVELTTTFEELEADSLDLFEVINEIEEEFNVQIEDAESITCIEDVINFINSQNK
ncbi:MAG: acyl carrier protein [Clostridiaceae bacterium]|nr:acyl carrier protein [Clostridiaceae bacterium]